MPTLQEDTVNQAKALDEEIQSLHGDAEKLTNLKLDLIQRRKF